MKDMNATLVTHLEPGEVVHLTGDFHYSEIFDYSNPDNFKNYLDAACTEYESVLTTLKLLRSELNEIDKNNGKMVLRAKKHEGEVGDRLWLVYCSPHPQLHMIINTKFNLMQSGYDDYIDSYCKSKLASLQSVEKNEANIT